MHASFVLIITAFLVLAVVFVNGWTDAPNAIATVVSTRSMKPRAAIIMAAILNFFGVLVMTWISPKVVDTMRNIVILKPNDKDSIVTLCAALFAIVFWALLAWWFGIPTSESHALIAGITGAAMALGGINSVNMEEWVKVLYGLVISTVLGVGAGFLIAKLVMMLFRGFSRRKADRFFRGAQITSGAAMAFMHGAQDGQKFIGVFILGLVLSGQIRADIATAPIWVMILCSAIMGVGTSIGGYRIIKSVGMDMVKLEKYQGFSADMAATGCLLLCTLTGIPISTTHTKTTAIMGVGAAKRLSSVNFGIVKEMVLAWVLTFPACGIIGFMMAKLFMLIF